MATPKSDNPRKKHSEGIFSKNALAILGRNHTKSANPHKKHSEGTSTENSPAIQGRKRTKTS